MGECSSTSERSREIQQLTYQIRVLESTLRAVREHAETSGSRSSESTIHMVEVLIEESKLRYAKLMGASPEQG